MQNRNQFNQPTGSQVQGNNYQTANSTETLSSNYGPRHGNTYENRAHHYKPYTNERVSNLHHKPMYNPFHHPAGYRPSFEQPSHNYRGGQDSNYYGATERRRMESSMIQSNQNTIANEFMNSHANNKINTPLSPQPSAQRNLVPEQKDNIQRVSYRRPDQDIKEDITEQLRNHWFVDSRNIHIKVEHGEVTLLGTVPERKAKRKAADLAEDVRGVVHVENRLRVEVPEYLQHNRIDR